MATCKITPDNLQAPDTIKDWYSAKGEELCKQTDCAGVGSAAAKEASTEITNLFASQDPDGKLAKYLSDAFAIAGGAHRDTQYQGVATAMQGGGAKGAPGAGSPQASVADLPSDKNNTQFNDFQAVWDQNVVAATQGSNGEPSTADRDVMRAEVYKDALNVLINGGKDAAGLQLMKDPTTEDDWDSWKANIIDPALTAAGTLETQTEATNTCLEELKNLKEDLDATVQAREDYLTDPAHTNKTGCKDLNQGESGKIDTEAEIETCNPATQTELEQLQQAKTGGLVLTVGLAASAFFREQCFLLSNILDFAYYKKYILEPMDLKPLPYLPVFNPMDDLPARNANACLQIDGESYGFVNKLTQSKHQNVFFNMRNKDIATLQPMIKLFKVDYNPEGTTEREIEMHFASNTTGDEIKKAFANKGYRGVGAGIKDFSFTYDGSTPFAAKKSIKAKLTITANNFDELFMDRTGPNGESYRYIDLALKTGQGTGEEKTELQEANLSKLNFRLKAVVGWAYPTGKVDHFGEWGITDGEAYKKTDLLDAIYDSFTTLNLTPTIHEFDIEETGRVNFTINYLAYVDDFYDQPTFNIFSDQEAAMDLIKRDLRYKNVLKDPGCKASDISEMKQEEGYKDIVTEAKIKNLRSLTRALMNKKKIRYLTVPFAEQMSFLEKGPFFNRSSGLYTRITNQAPKTVGDALADALLSDATSALGDDPYADMSPQEKHEAKVADDAEYAEVDGLCKQTGGLLSPWRPTGSLDDSADCGNPNSPIRWDWVAAEVGRRHAQPDPVADPSAPTGPGLPTTSAPPTRMNLNEYNVAFFYISDLVDIVLEGIDQYLEQMPSKIKEQTADLVTGNKINKDDMEAEISKLHKFKKQFKRFRVLLGPLELVSPKDNVASLFVNFGDVPISLKYFIEWLTDKMVSREKSVYPLSKFLSDLFNNLVRTFLNDDTCFGYAVEQKTRVNQAVLTSYSSERLKNGQTVDEVTAWIKKEKSKIGGKRRGITHLMDMPILNVSGKSRHPVNNPGIDKEMNYLVFFAGRTQPAELMNGKKSDDEERGIFHYMLGRDRGIVKTINLTRTDAKFLREVRFEQEGYNGLEQLREVYDVDIQTFANVKTFPGTYIFVEPKGWAPNSSYDLTRLGIGGYCMIIRSEHSFGPGKAESKITAKWVASIGAKSGAKVPVEIPDSGRSVNSGDQKCKWNRKAAAADETWWSTGMSSLESLLGVKDDVGSGDG